MRTAIVLAGGQSRRFGRDKSQLPWGSSDLIHSILKKLSTVCCESIVVSNRAWEPQLPGIRVVADLIPQKGPLSGIHAGLSCSNNPYAFVTGCDMPFVSGLAVEYLFEQAEGYDALIPKGPEGPEPLAAVYHRNCIQPIERLLHQDIRKTQALFSLIRVRFVDTEELRRFDAELNLFRNINTPAEYEKAKELGEEFFGGE